MKHQLLFGFGFLCLVSGVALAFHLMISVAESYGQVQAFEKKSMKLSRTNNIQPTQKQTDKPKTVEWTKKPKQGSKIAKLNIPAIKISVPVYMGVSDKELSKGVGLHGSLPGKGRVALAGHRETAFSKADQIKVGDRFELETKKGLFIYKITKHQVVDANDRSIVVDSDKRRPFYTRVGLWSLELRPTSD